MLVNSDNMKMLNIILLSVIFASVCSANQCDTQICSDCIQIPNCMWCAKTGNFTSDDGPLPRCSSGQEHNWRHLCGEENVVAPANFFEILTDEELTQAGVLAGVGGGGVSLSGETVDKVVQLKPQRVGMRLRVQESESMVVHFRQAEDYPVDLYYLMDLSKSMEDDKDSLSALGQDLADEMQKLTRNFRLGFGSFVDKVVMPYVSTVPSKLEHPCDNCAKPYGFINALRLTERAEDFVTQVKEAPVSGNLDAPEGGFDAIMQAIMCKDEIGWREKARHLLVFSTDAGFHYAGDGKLGGIVKPNDGLCHLDSKGSYTHSTLQDYPSVAQINMVAKQEHINLIFAVSSEQISVYRHLSKMIEGSGYGELTKNSSNVVELVKEEYQKITSKIELKDNATAPVFIRYFSSCQGGEERETSLCDGLHVGDEVQFRVEVTVDSCPKDSSEWRQTIRIAPVALSDQLILDLEMICDCPCEREGEPGALECSGIGTYQCGVCACPVGFTGRHCECSSDTPYGLGVMDDVVCRAPNDTRICSGRGSCSCGTCQCNARENPEEIIEGEFCQCTNFLCDRYKGKLCSGPSYGICKCNTCICKPGWTGDACECRNSTENCINPKTKKICSGNGICECNECICNQTSKGRYIGQWCEECPTCNQKCIEYKACVQCQIFQKGEYDEEACLANCTLFNATAEDVLEIDEETERSCSFYDENDCRFRFVYGYDGNRVPVVRVQKTLECPPKLDILGIVLGVIGAIVAVGIALLLMWKLLTTIHDRREYARFEKERMMAKWDTGENPIYKQATSTFKNPIYGRK